MMSTGRARKHIARTAAVSATFMDSMPSKDCTQHDRGCMYLAGQCAPLSARMQQHSQLVVWVAYLARKCWNMANSSPTFCTPRACSQAGTSIHRRGEVCRCTRMTRGARWHAVAYQIMVAPTMKNAKAGMRVLSCKDQAHLSSLSWLSCDLQDHSAALT